MTRKIGIAMTVAAVGLALPHAGLAFDMSRQQPATFTPLPDGHIYSVDGIAAATAITQTEGGAVFADVVADQSAIGNSVVEENVARSAIFENSGNNNAGIVLFNQEAGNMNNQANVVAIALGEDAPISFADIMASQTLSGNSVVSDGPRETRISGAFNDTTGIVGINQSAGNLNQQLNVVAIAMGKSSGPDVVALADSQLENVAANGNELTPDNENPRHNFLVDSFTGFEGIAQVSQSSGDLNRIANTVSFSVEVMTIR